MVYLDNAEWEVYQTGQRIFELNNNIVRIRVEDPPPQH
jgi:hypothetical protein